MRKNISIKSSEFLLLLAFLLFSLINANSQESNLKVQEQIKDPNLKKLYALLIDLIPQKYFDWEDEAWEQKLIMDEDNRLIYYKIRPYSENNKSHSWYAAYHIPLLCVDNMTMNIKESSLTFLSEGDKIGIFQGGYRVGFRNTISIRINSDDVNVLKKLKKHLKNSQKENKAIKPERAKDLIGDAVYSYLKQRDYQTSAVKKLLVNNKLYIPKCQICEGTKKGFTKYTENTNITFDLTNQTHDLRVGLFWGTIEEQLLSLEKLVEEAIKEYYLINAFSDQQIAEMKSLLESERKRSMAMTSGKKCASCDGACSK
jgi:hypothetical protein